MDDPLWSLSSHALGVADDVYYKELKTVSIEDYSDGVLTKAGQQPLVADLSHREVYADSLFDLQRLLEEIRFEIAFATMLTSDYRARHPIEDEPPADPDAIEVTVPVEILAVLSTYAAPIPSPSQLVSDLHGEIPGGRHLSRWLAAQLLDGAMLRSLSVLDRVATMLHLRAGLSLTQRKDGSLRLPSFSIEQLKAMRPAYDQHPSWPVLRAVAADDMYKFIKRYRDGGVHHRRWPSELHGETKLTYWDTAAKDSETPAQRQYEGLTAQMHIALTLATWNVVLLPVVAAGGQLVASKVAEQDTSDQAL
jgi:hypothetical protein